MITTVPRQATYDQRAPFPHRVPSVRYLLLRAGLVEDAERIEREDDASGFEDEPAQQRLAAMLAEQRTAGRSGTRTLAAAGRQLAGQCPVMIGRCRPRRSGGAK